jgi:pseudouridine-5'-phosphate glycosidase
LSRLATPTRQSGWRPPEPLRATAAAAAAFDAGRPVVALESSVLAQGLPIPANAEAHARMCAGVAGAGAEPVVTAVVRGVPSLGLDGDDLARFLARDGVRKVSARDLGFAMARGLDGATTVAATLALCVRAGIQLFATGGIGGVHREPALDESSDLPELARSPVIVVCAGAKSILDLPGTMERLETLGVPVVGYRTNELPGFFTVGTGLPLALRADSAEEIARIFIAHRAVGRPGALVVVQPPPPADALPRGLVDSAVTAALAEARRQGVRGSAVTPFLLAAVDRATGGRSLGANLALLEANSRLGGEIAVALHSLSGGGQG